MLITHSPSGIIVLDNEGNFKSSLDLAIKEDNQQKIKGELEKVLDDEKLQTDVKSLYNLLRTDFQINLNYIIRNARISCI